MTTLNLETKNPSQEIIKTYLEQHVEDAIADKINNGVRIIKDGAMLINRKDLDSFWQFATAEARKLEPKGSGAIVQDNIVFGWAMHYFEEDSIEGKLFNIDGTEYKPPRKTSKSNKPAETKKPVQQKPVIAEKPKPAIQQPSFFDMLGGADNTAKPEPSEPEDVEDEIDEDEDVIDDEGFEGEELEDEVDSLVEQESVDSEPVIHAAASQEDNGPSVEEIADSLQSALDEKHGVTHKPEPAPEPKPEPIPKKDDLYEKYSDYALRHPDSVIVMRVGDFYEVFGKNAVELANRHEIQPTSRTFGGKQIPMIGIPVHAADIYFSRFRKYRKLYVIDGSDVKVIPEYGFEDYMDGSVDDIDDDLSEEFMQKFDGMIEEPNEAPSESKDNNAIHPVAFQRIKEILGGIIV